MIVLNGTSSSGKSSIARALQAMLPDRWLTFSIDDLIDAMPAALTDHVDGLSVGEDGTVGIGENFRTLNIAWEHGLAAMARAGAPVIIDDVLLGGVAGQVRWSAALRDLDVLWVGVRCDPDELTRREIARGDRRPGMAASQIGAVHDGVRYDVEVDTSAMTLEACAGLIVSGSRRRGSRADHQQSSARARHPPLPDPEAGQPGDAERAQDRRDEEDVR